MSAGKVCIICNQDCSTRPRVKDDLGRYTCQECLAKEAKARGSAAKVAAGPGRSDAGAPDLYTLDSDALDLRAAAAAEATAPVVDLPEQNDCPKCHGFMAEGQRICTRCGYDRIDKRANRTKVVRERASKSRGGGGGGMEREMIIALVLGVGSIALAGVGFISPDFAASALLANLILAGLVGLTIRVCQAIDNDWVWFVLGWFIGVTDLIWLVINHRTWLKVLFGLVVVGLIGSVAAGIMGDPNLFSGE